MSDGDLGYSRAVSREFLYAAFRSPLTTVRAISGNTKSRVEGGEAKCVARIADRQRSKSGLSTPRKAIAGSVAWIARSSSTNGAVVC
jgi:hypothetical protein